MNRQRNILILVVGCVFLWISGTHGALPLDRAEHIVTENQDFTVDYGQFDGNRICTWTSNVGDWVSYRATSYPGMEWPKGSGISNVFQSGLFLVSGQTKEKDSLTFREDIRTAVAEFFSQFQPGQILYFDTLNQVVVPMSHYPQEHCIWKAGDPADPSYRLYKINRQDSLSADYLNWPAEQGAPVDESGKPLFSGDQMVWSVYNDMDTSLHTSTLGGAPMGVEIQTTLYGFDRSDILGDVLFVRSLVINKSDNHYKEMYAGIWAAPELGMAWDNCAGVDTSLTMGYVFNGVPEDLKYGLTPPAVGFTFLQRPQVQSPGDTASWSGKLRPGWREVDLSGFIVLKGSPTLNQDPNNKEEAYNVVRGLKKGGGSWIDPMTGEPTRFHYTGDPVTGEGWLNITEVPPGDRRFLFSAGPFEMAPCDTQEIVTAIIVAQGHNHIRSVAALRFAKEYVQTLFDTQFDFSSLSLAGDYYIPQGEHEQGFGDLAAAISAVNGTGLSAPVRLLIDGSLLTDEIYPIHLERPDLTEFTSLTIMPVPETSPEILLMGEAGFDIQNTSWVTLDGSGGDSSAMTFRLQDETGAAVIRIVDDCKNITIRNLSVQYESAASTSRGILIDRNSTSPVSPQRITLEKNTIGTEEKTFTDAIAIWGNDLSLPVDSVCVRDNLIYAGRRGITTYYIKDNEYTGNTIHVTGQHVNNTWHGGIYVCGGVGTIHVHGNEISGLAVNGTGYAGGILLNASVNEVNVYNNFIAANLTNAGMNTTNNVYGIVINNPSAGNPVNIMHNTIYLPETELTGRHAGLGWERDTQEATTVNFVNNIVVNEQNLENSYGIHWPWTSGLDWSDYNNIYVSGSNASTGYWGSAVHKTLTDWQSATNKEEHSVAVPVEFVSITDLHITGSSDGDVNLAGIPVEWISEDIDGNSRDTDHPYKGAHEGSTLVISHIEENLLPESYELGQNYPNPFNPVTTIPLAMPKSGEVHLVLYDLTGRLVQDIYRGYLNAGYHTFTFTVGTLSSGVYICRVNVNDFTAAKKMTIVK